MRIKCSKLKLDKIGAMLIIANAQKKNPRRTLIEGKLGATIAKNVMRTTQPVKNTLNTMKEPKVIEIFADNGEHSHWQLVNEMGEVVWSEDPSEITSTDQSDLSNQRKVEKYDEIKRMIERAMSNNWKAMDVLKGLIDITAYK